MKAKAKVTVKPCPFCGAEVNKFKGPMMDTVMFVCKGCGADVCFYGGEREPFATLKWNKRVADEQET